MNSDIDKIEELKVDSKLPRRHFLSKISAGSIHCPQSSLGNITNWLITQADSSRLELDLREFWVILPGARASRRMLEKLVLAAEQLGKPLLPPRFLTPGNLLEQLSQGFKGQSSASPSMVVATEFEQISAIVQSIENLAHSQPAILKALLPTMETSVNYPQLPSLFGHARALHDLFEIFSRENKELSQLVELSDDPRWKACYLIEQYALEILEMNFRCTPVQSARAAIQSLNAGDLSPQSTRIVLAGVPDLGQLAIDLLQNRKQFVDILICAPEQYKDRFDNWGIIDTEAWQDVQLVLGNEQVQFVAQPSDQANAAIQKLSLAQNKYSTEEFCIGLADSTLAPTVLRRLQAAGARGHNASGSTLGISTVAQFLRLLPPLLEGRDLESLAALVRHPMITDHLKIQNSQLTVGPEQILMALDRYRRRYLPSKWPRQWQACKDGQLLATFSRIVDKWFEPLTASSHSLRHWAEIFAQLVRYFHLPICWNLDLPKEDKRARELEALAKVLESIYLMADGLSPQCDAATALRLIIEQIDQICLAEPTKELSLEVLGWLELPLDDAKMIVVVGFNEHAIPGSPPQESLLNNTIREQVGLPDDRRRYAREAFALDQLTRHSEELFVIAGRFGPDGDPLIPSRLLLTGSARNRAQRLLAFGKGDSINVAYDSASMGDRKDLSVPQPRAMKSVLRSLRVSAFKDYIACPYRFYLRHVLKLRVMDDKAEELDGAAFGNLAHLILDEFGKSEFRSSVSHKEIFDYLQNRVAFHGQNSYCRTPLPAVKFQLEQLKTRLDYFSRWQADWSDQGYELVHSEYELPAENSSLTVDFQSFSISGRIDRIDRHRETGEWIIFDYKTSDQARNPELTHRKKLHGGAKQWVDLQLPLYQFFITNQFTGPVRTAYLNLPKNGIQCGAQFAEWDKPSMESALDCAFSIIRSLREQKFWPPSAPPPAFSEEFADICQDGLLMAGGDDLALKE